MQAWVTVTIGVVGTLAGVVLAQWFNSHQESKRWERERERDQQRRADEAAARTFEHRRDAYVGFVQQWHKFYNIAAMARIFSGQAVEDPPEDWLEPLWDQLMLIQVYGTTTAHELAGEAYQALHKYAYDGEEWESYPLRGLISRVRIDLGVPE